MTNPCKFKIGDKVNTRRWDRLVLKERRMNGGKVIGIRADDSESGWMIYVQPNNTNLGPLALDQNWLTP